MDSKLVEHTTYTTEGERKNRSIAEQERFGICCSISEETDGSTGGLIVYGAEMKVEIDLSPSSIPTRKSFQLVPFIMNNSDDKNMGEGSSSTDKKKKEEESDDKKDTEAPQDRRPTKRIKTNAATTTTTTTTTE
mmetsp:Transcript_50157/g.56811  ORF Transcript_50157/g.56811 Transcript_50157/m.56811 type:complete len:134 (+) Transcript_50157:132-533(+)